MAKGTKVAKKDTAGKGGAAGVRPLGEKVLIRRLEAEERTRGGIVLPDTAKEKPQKGKVLAVGDGKLLEDGTRAAFQVKVGDTVLFASYAGTEIKLEREELMLMDESDILAVLD
jgi:chaperonin GroES